MIRTRGEDGAPGLRVVTVGEGDEALDGVAAGGDSGAVRGLAGQVGEREGGMPAGGPVRAAEVDDEPVQRRGRCGRGERRGSRGGRRGGSRAGWRRSLRIYFVHHPRGFVWKREQNIEEGMGTKDR